MKDIDKVEAEIDASWEASNLPGSSWQSAALHLVVATEDATRLLALESPLRASIYANTAMFALKRALNLCRANLPTDARWAWTGVDPDSYRLAAQLLKRAEGYETITRAFTEYHSGEALADLDNGSGRLVFARDHEYQAYRAYDALSRGNTPRCPFDILAHAVASRSQSEFPATVIEIAKLSSVSTEDKRHIVEYDFCPPLAVDLGHLLPEAERIVPLNWTFPWASQADFRSVSRALAIRCAYHFIAIHFASMRAKIGGGGVDHLPLLVTKDSLARDLSNISKVPEDIVLQTLHALTLGNLVRTPDQALQPLIQVGEDMCVLAPLQVSALSFGRNALTLHARRAPSSFDSQSKSFEQMMTSEFRSELASRQVVTNKHFSLPPAKSEEIDAVVFDLDEKTALLMEFIWHIPTADPREESAQRKKLSGKVEQLARKLNSARGACPAFLKQLGVTAPFTSDDWALKGLVVVKGGSGGPQGVGDGIPVCPFDLVVETLNQHPGLEEAHEHLQSGTWLPREGQHYRVQASEVQAAGYGVFWPTIGFLNENLRTETEPEKADWATFIATVVRYNSDCSGTLILAERIPYSRICKHLEQEPFYNSLPSRGSGQEFGNRLLARLRDLGEQKVLAFILLSYLSESGSAEEVADAERILAKAAAQLAAREVVDTPRGYYQAAEDVMFIAAVIDDRFWDGTW